MPADAIGEALVYGLKLLVRGVLECAGEAGFEWLWDRGCYWTGRIVWWLSWPIRVCFTPVKVRRVSSPASPTGDRYEITRGERGLTEDGYKAVGLVTWVIIGVVSVVFWVAK